MLYSALPRLLRAAICAWLAVATFAPLISFAQEPTKPEPKPSATKPDAAKPEPAKPDATKPNVAAPKPTATASAPAPAVAPKDVPIKEQTIYIPYTKLREIFETEKRGVFLPYDKFQELWKAARENERVAPDVKPPVDTLISEVLNEAVVSRDVVKVAAKVKIELLGTGWHEVPLRLADAAITSATIDGKPARILFDKTSGYRLVVERVKDGPQQLELQLEYAKTFVKRPGTNSVSFASPQAPVSRWQVKLDEPGVKIDIHPLIAASDVPPADPKQPRSEILAFVGAAETVRIDWTPRAEGATGLEVLAGVQTEEQVAIDETAVHTRATLLYTISRATLSQLRIDVPVGHRVANVYEANVKRWSIEKPAADNKTTQRILVELFEPAKQTQSIVVELEQIHEAAAARTSVVPVITAVDVGRQQGIVVVQVADGLRAEAEKHSGLIQLDTGDLPATLLNKHWAFSYRYAAVPFDLSLKIEKVQPRITTELLVEASLQPEKLVLDAKARILIEKAGIFQLDLEIPKGFELGEVRGFQCDGVEPLAVDGFRIEGTDKNKVVVNLTRKAIGRVGLALQLTKALTDPELKTPLGREASIVFSLPAFAKGTIERSSGRLIVHAPESLRVNPGEAKGLRTVSFQEALAGVELLRSVAALGTRPVQAFTFADAPAELTLAVERRKPQVTVQQLLTAKVEAGVVKYQAQFFYEILYSPIRSLRIDIPEKIVGTVHNDTAGVRESLVAPPPADLAPGYVAWSLAGESEFMGKTTLKLSWETPVEKLEVGSSVVINLPHLKPRLVDRASGQIVLLKAEAIDLREVGDTKEGKINPIDPQVDLMPGASAAGAARAFEFNEDWTLAIEATRYKLEEMKRTSIERAVVRAVVTRSGQTSVQALYRLRTARQRLALTLPSGASFDDDSLKINGLRIPLERGNQNEYFIPIAGQTSDKSMLLELRYTLAGQGTKFDLPAFPEEPAVQQVYLCTYLPEEWAVVRSDGPWNDEFRWYWGPTDWRYTGGSGYIPVAERNDDYLIAWVKESITLLGNPTDNFTNRDSFRHDGRLLVFSALHPEKPPAGSLKLVVVHRNLLNGLMLLVVLGGGVLLARSRLAVRAAVVGVAILALFLARTFEPLLIIESINGIFEWSVILVGLLWIVAWIVRRSKGFGGPAVVAVAPPTRPNPPTGAAPVPPVVPPAPATPESPPSVPPPAAPAAPEPTTPLQLAPQEPTTPLEIAPTTTEVPDILNAIAGAPTVTPPVTPPQIPEKTDPLEEAKPNEPRPDWAAPKGDGHE